MFKLHRILIAYAVAVPLALVLGCLVAVPDIATFAVVGLVLVMLALPLLIQWDHWLLIFFWNSVFIGAFLPGQMQIWIIFAALTFVMALINRFMGHRNFLRAPELTKPILFLTAVVLLTGKIRGGLGMRALGSGSYGGKNYFLILMAIVGYYALISQPVAVNKGARAVKLFFLAGTTNALGNLIYMAGPMAYFLYWILPTSSLGGQVVSDWSDSSMHRLAGFGSAGPFLLCFALARWGLRGLFEWDRPWRLLWLLAALVVALFSGFRSEILFLVALLAVQFTIEGYWKTAMMPVMVLLGILCLTPVLLFANRMPGSVQRSLAFLPVNINPDIRADADASVNWRVDMWKEVWPEIPKYLLIGKGYAIDPGELAVTVAGAQAGYLGAYEGSLIAGDYHNGPLTVLIPFGVFGLIAFLWLLVAGAKVLYRNYRYGHARLRLVNATLMAYFLTTSLFFFFVVGAFNVQLSVFLGLLGMSVSINGGVCRRPAVARQSTLSSSLASPVAVG
jgi:O-antigen ligase